MINFKPLFLILLFSFNVSYSFGQSKSKYERKIFFPDLDNYKTLLTDFHQHTVFSDGAVWPSIRVEEAIRDGLDAISLTEHLEYQPYAKDIPHPDRNRSYIVASQSAEGKNKNLEKKSYSGYKRQCYQAGQQTTNKQGKIELLSQWKLEAEFRNRV